MNIVPNLHRTWSIYFIIASVVFSSAIVAYQGLPTDWIPKWALNLPEWAKTLVTLLDVSSSIGAGVSRAIQQVNLHGDDYNG